MSGGISDSQFHMWRTLFALIHADDVVTYEEIRFMAETFEDVDFSDVQRRILEEDIKTPQDPVAMFEKVTDAEDRTAFFKHAHRLVHIDGNYAPEERNVMVRLQKMHIDAVNVDALVGTVTLQFEEEKADTFDIGVVDFKDKK